MFELSIAERHILGNPRMVLFTVLSVALAVGVIVVLIGLTEGYRQNLIDNTVENSPHVTVDPKLDEDYIYLYRTLTSIAEERPEVLAASSRLVGRAAAKYKDNVEGVTFIGADPVQEDLLLRVREDMIWGDYYDLRFKRYAAVVGDKLAENLELKRGDDFRLVRQNASIQVKAVGIIDTRTGLDSTLVYLPLETAQILLGDGDVVTEMGIRLSDIYAAPAVAADLNERTRYKAESWQDKSRDILDQLETQQVYSIIFYILIAIIAGFGIANTMIMIITRRTKEIGILNIRPGERDPGAALGAPGRRPRLRRGEVHRDDRGAGRDLHIRQDDGNPGAGYVPLCSRLRPGSQLHRGDIPRLQGLAAQPRGGDSDRVISVPRPTVVEYFGGDLTLSNIIEIKKLRKVYGDGVELLALDDVDLTIKEGEVLAIVGPSGSGKSTLLNMIGLLDTPSDGEIWLKGQNITKASPKERARLRNKELGFIFQYHHLLPEFDAVENVMMPLLIAGMDKKEARHRAITLLEEVGLGPEPEGGGGQGVGWPSFHRHRG